MEFEEGKLILNRQAHVAVKNVLKQTPINC